MSGKHLLSLVGGALLAAAPWLLKNWVFMGAPLYPFLASTQAPGWAVHRLGFPERLNFTPAEHGWAWLATGAFNLHDLFLNPGRLTIEIEGMFYFTSIFVALAPVAIALRNRKAKYGLYYVAAPAIAYLVVIVWAFPRSNLRYYLPGLIPLAGVGAAALTIATSRHLRRIAVGVAILSLTPSLFAAISLTVLIRPDRYVLGQMTAADNLAGQYRLGDMESVITYANAHLNEDELILLLFEARGYYFDVPVIQDNKTANWEYVKSSGAAMSCLAGTGISHVLLRRGAFGFFVDRGIAQSVAVQTEISKFANRCLVPIYTTKNFECFA